jgi:hypothetical protein
LNLNCDVRFTPKSEQHQQAANFILQLGC